MYGTKLKTWVCMVVNSIQCTLGKRKIPETSVVYFPELYLHPLIDHLCRDLTISPHVGQLPLILPLIFAFSSRKQDHSYYIKNGGIKCGFSNYHNFQVEQQSYQISKRHIPTTEQHPRFMDATLACHPLPTATPVIFNSY